LGKPYERITNETEIFLEWMDIPGQNSIESPCGFFNHMFQSMLYYSGLSIKLNALGDTHIDHHHLVEDIGILFGRAFSERFSDQPIKRFGSVVMPMDGSLVMIALDIGGRSGLFWNINFPTERCGNFDLEILREFWAAFTREAKLTLHFQQICSDNSHHLAEAAFKGAGIALNEALEPSKNLRSTKGTLN